MTKEITIICPLHVEFEVRVEKNAYCRSDEFYIVPDRNTPKHLQTIHNLKLESSMLRLKYDNVLKGLNYWKARANETDRR